MFARRWLAAIVLTLSAAATAAAEDAFFRVPLSELKLTDGKLPEEPQEVAIRNWRLAQVLQPYIALDGKGEAFMPPRTTYGIFYFPSLPRAQTEIMIRAPKGADVTGRLFVPNTDHSGMVALKFKVPASAAKDDFAKGFYQQKADYYRSLEFEGIPGGAWFRHQVREAERQLGKTPPTTAAPGAVGMVAAPAPTFRGGALEDSYDLFSGGRALSENLQLDRAMPVAAEKLATVDLSSIEGITIHEIDWQKEANGKELKPAADPLAAAIPADQHAVFFPTFAKLLEVADNADQQGTRILRLIQPRSEDAGTQERYERQLCVSTSALSRLLGPKLVRSVAITGSDPYFATGTDVAVVLEAANSQALVPLLAARIAIGAQTDPQTKAVEGAIEGVPYSGFRSPDRAVCSYLAHWDNVVVITNSLAQLTQLVQVHQGKSPAIASLPEYRFFRSRYALGDADESAFLFLSDATIRRWCGPRWRIASGRRTRDAAVLSELQAGFLDELASHHVESGPIHTDLDTADIGDLRLSAAGVNSSTLGTLEFQTPIIELPLDKITKEEAVAYGRWRDTYQQNWRWAFDPIALRITANEKLLGADLTVMPLIFASEYREMMDVARGASIKPTAGDPHDALAHWIMAFNRDSQSVRSAGNFAQGMLQGATDPFSWIGQSISVYADDDPFWQGLAKQDGAAARQKFLEENLGRLPVAIQIEVESPLKLTAFIVALRGMIEQSAPGMVAWESLKYHDQPYVKLSATERAKKELPPGIKEPTLFYVISGDALLITLNEDLLKRALDRREARDKAKAEGKELPAEGKPWLGFSACLQLEGRTLALVGQLLREDYRTEMQLLAWSNLPILNEWKRRYPDQDPVQLHEHFFQTRLVCPGGGKYVWNDQWQTMESTVFGSPSQPKAGPALPLPLGDFLGLNFGLTFESHGLRSRLELQRGQTGGQGSGVGGQ